MEENITTETEMNPTYESAEEDWEEKMLPDDWAGKETDDSEAAPLEKEVDDSEDAPLEKEADDSETHLGEEQLDIKEKQNSEFLQLTEMLAGVNGKLDELTNLFTRKIQHTSHEEKLVDQMHLELQKYKDDLYSQLVRPILLDIIEIRDSILRMSSVYALKPEEEQAIPLKTFYDYSYDIQDVLEKNDISIYVGKEGDAFNPAKQQVVKKIPTTTEELHGTIAASINSGYEYLGKTISAEKVAVFVYEKPTEKEGEKE